MSDTQNTPAPANNGGENTPQTEKKSLWARAKARKERFATNHPFACELGRQLGYGAAYMGGILAIATAYVAVTKGDGSEDTPDELEAADPEEEILSDDEE